MSAKVLPMPAASVADEMRVTGLAIYLATINGEDWRLVSDTRMAKLEHIARLALSAMKGGDRG